MLVNCLSPGAGVSAVIPDERAAGAAAAQALLDAGHREGIHLVGEPAPTCSPGASAWRGSRRHWPRRGRRWPASSRAPGRRQPACRAVADFLAGGGVPAALICLNDRVALGAYQALYDADRRVPGDVSVVSFDDSDLASWVRPTLSSVALPHEALGRVAVELVLDPPGEAEVRRLPMPLRRRESVAPPRGR